MRQIYLSITFFIILLTSPPFSSGGEVFLSNHWSRPANGLAGLSMEASDLHPDSCAKCHRSKYDDWRGSLHSKSVGPGLLSQLDPHNNPQLALSCYFCHAPLAEQNEIVEGAGKSGYGDYLKNSSFDETLKLSGVSCAACHMRGEKVYGPPSPDKSKISMADADKKHASVEKDDFEDARFCAACHQMDKGFELNGKLLTNTFMEWKKSYYGENNISCQSCHMPGRRHLFRGIHDPDMVRSGVELEVIRKKSNSTVSATRKVTNLAVGHYFPTYITPQVVVNGFLVDSKGDILTGTKREATIGRWINLSLTEELFDTRIAPKESIEFDYEVTAAANAKKLVVEVTVYPDEFYNRFFKSALNRDDPGMKREKIEEALKATELSSYLLFRDELVL